MDFIRELNDSTLYTFHSHTEFCDGRAQMEAFARRAVADGFTHYGFTPHSPIPIESPCNMRQADVPRYLDEVEHIRRDHGDRCRFYAGMEIDYLEGVWGPAEPYFATLSLEDSTVPMIYGVIPILMIVCMDVFMSFIMLKNSRFRRLVTGTPQIIITDGIIDRKVMKHLRYSVDELMEAMRECMIFDISQVQYAIVETTGKINFYQKSRYRNVENGDVGVQVTNCDPPCLLIKDGEINYPGLRRWNGDEAKLREIIKSMKLDIKDIFLLTDSTDKGIYTVLKSNDKYGTKPICKAEDK